MYTRVLRPYNLFFFFFFFFYKSKMPRDPHKLMDSPWIWMGHRVVTSHFTHFRVPNLLHSSTRPRCGIRRSDLAIYISCATESERLVGFFCILGVWFHVSLKSRTLQDPHAAGMSKMDFLFVYFSKLQGGLPRHSRKSLIYCLIKIHLYPLYSTVGGSGQMALHCNPMEKPWYL